jgi:putative salt-induced outer membrane protein YdiY
VTRALAVAACAALGLVRAASAQEAAPAAPSPEPAWKGSIGAGLALTSGNSDTRTYNASFAAAYDPKRKNSLRSDGLYLRSDTAGAATVDKTALGLRDEYRLDRRSFVFAEAKYLRDRFKGIDYLLSPVVGIGVKLLDAERAQLSLDAALGGKFERDAARRSTSDGAAQASQRLSWKLSKTATFTQQVAALFKLTDFGDSLLRFEVGLAASVSRRTELKLAVADEYKSRPSDPQLKKNDASLLAAFVFKIG